MTPRGTQKRPRGAAGHVLELAAPTVPITAGLALERDAAVRGRRLLTAAGAAIGGRVRRRRRMRALVAAPGGRLTWRAVPAPPPPGPGAAVVRPVAAATCDMDRPLVQGRTPFPLPLRLGHECVAEVLAVGDGVTSVVPGDRVVVPFQIHCGGCPPCRRGHTANCAAVPPLSMYGFGIVGGHWGGAYADELAVPFAEAMLTRLPSGVDPVAVASVADTVCDGYRHVAPHLPALLAAGRRAEVTVVAALDPCPIYSPSTALYAALTARALGADTVNVVDSRASVRALAARLGLTPVLPAERRGLAPAPLVVEVTGHPRGLRAALRLTEPDGIASSASGLYASARIPTATMFARNQTLHVGRTHSGALVPEVLDLVRGGRLRPGTVTTTIAALDDAPAALRHHHTSHEVKTVLTADPGHA